jgi:hypothetical protein
MLNVTSLVSRISHRREKPGGIVVRTAVPGLEDKIHTGVADVGCTAVRLTQCALKKLV